MHVVQKPDEKFTHLTSTIDPPPLLLYQHSVNLHVCIYKKQNHTHIIWAVKRTSIVFLGVIIWSFLLQTWGLSENAE